jgi:ArsR family transcriptional regulator, arsenate/arsenite/antimonite-responsive transcriptional repressor
VAVDDGGMQARLIYQLMLMYEEGMTTIIARSRRKMVRLFHALSDETRLRLLEQLREGEQCVCELTDAFKMGQSRLSFHLRVLKDAGLVTDRPEGRWIYYSLNRAAIGELEDLVAWFNESSSRKVPARRC